jgi:hypothetical protein
VFVIYSSPRNRRVESSLRTRGWIGSLLVAFALAQGGCLAEQAEEPSAGASAPDDQAATVVDDGQPLAEPARASLASPEIEAAVAPAAACTVAVTPASQLMITNLAVVNDPVRTRWTGSVTNASDGAWHFGRLMAQMAGGNNPTTFVRSWLAQWESNVTVNGQVVPARASIASQVLAAWPKTSTGAIDLTKAPMRLLAIVNRFDLRTTTDAGEARFVYGVLGPSGAVLPFTIILEYRVPVSGATAVAAWARLWRDLASSPLGSAAYRTKLQAITDRFTARGAAPSKVNASAISQVRTNENALNPLWELREFRLTSTGQLRMVPPALTPANGFNNSPTLATFMTQNSAAIKAQAFTVPASFGGQPFAAGSVTNRIDLWAAPGITDSTLRHRFSLNTCNACHGAETQTVFLHVAPRSATSESTLSRFLTGVTVADPITGANRTFNDLAKRSNILRNFLCANP